MEVVWKSDHGRARLLVLGCIGSFGPFYFYAKHGLDHSHGVLPSVLFLDALVLFRIADNII